MDAVRKAIADQVFADLGITIHESQFPSSPRIPLVGVADWTPLTTARIAPAMCGPLAPMFTAIAVKISAAYHAESNTVYLRYQYSYTHPDRGSNGYDVQKTVKL